MFESAIEKISQFTRPMHIISRSYSGLIFPGTSTFFFVNNNGVAITCKHVANMIPGAENLNAAYSKFKIERDKLVKDGNYNRNLKGLELKYKFEKNTTVQMKHNFMNCFDKLEEITCHAHPTLDL